MKLKRLLLLPFFLVVPSFALYQQQWFSQFQEQLDGTLQFVCSGQCMALIAPIAWSDYVKVQGNIQGNGIVGYGFLVGQQMAPAQTLPVNGMVNLDQQFTFQELPFYNQLPQDAQLVIVVEGALSGTMFSASLWSLWISQKLAQWRKDFWTMESLTPYSINLRYGVTILWTSLLHYWYWLFIIAALYILIFIKGDKHKKFRMVCFWWLGIFLFIGARNLVTYTWIVHQWLQQYTNAPEISKTFFDLWDYISFTQAIRDKLSLDTQEVACKIFINSYQDWPFKAHRELLYLKPCSVTLTWSEADYIIYYHTPVASWDVSKPIMLQYHDNYLLQNK